MKTVDIFFHVKLIISQKDRNLYLSRDSGPYFFRAVFLQRHTCRKNFLFANTPGGARGSAIIFSMIQTAIENGLDPYRYLTWLLRTAKDLDLQDESSIQRCCFRGMHLTSAV